MSSMQQLKVHPDKACVSWRCVHRLQRTSHSFHCMQPNFTVHYSTIDNVVGLLSRLEKGAMMAKVDLKSAFRMVPIQVSEWNSRPELTHDGGTASYHLGMAFLCSSPQIGTMQSPSSCTRIPPAPVHVVLGPTWMGPGSESTAHTSASRAGRALEGCLRHLLHRAVAPSASTTYRAGIRKYYAFCHKFNLTTLPRNQALHQPFLSQTGRVRKDRLWEREVYQSRHAYPS